MGRSTGRPKVRRLEHTAYMELVQHYRDCRDCRPGAGLLCDVGRQLYVVWERLQAKQLEGYGRHLESMGFDVLGPMK